MRSTTKKFKGKHPFFYASFHWNLKWFVDLVRMHEVILFGTEFYNEIKRSRFKAPIWMSFFHIINQKGTFWIWKKVLCLLPSYDLKIRGYINLHFPFFPCNIWEVCNAASQSYYRIVANRSSSCLVTVFSKQNSFSNTPLS